MKHQLITFIALSCLLTACGGNNADQSAQPNGLPCSADAVADEWYGSFGDEKSHPEEFLLHDIDADGTDELCVRESSKNRYAVYSVADERLLMLDLAFDAYTRLGVAPDGILASFYDFNDQPTQHNYSVRIAHLDRSDLSQLGYSLETRFCHYDSLTETISEPYGYERHYYLIIDGEDEEVDSLKYRTAIPDYASIQWLDEMQGWKPIK